MSSGQGVPTPTHVAIIMDGNGRWAQMRGLPRQEGHRRGLEALRRTVRNASDLGIAVLTLYSFSTENCAPPSCAGWASAPLLRGWSDIADSGAAIGKRA